MERLDEIEKGRLLIEHTLLTYIVSLTQTPNSSSMAGLTLST